MSRIINFIPPYSFIFELDSGALQEVRGTVDQGFWQIRDQLFFVNFPFKDGIVQKEVSPGLARGVNWNLILEKFTNNDYANLPTRTEFINMSIEDFLSSIGALTVEVIPNTIINGQPAQQIVIVPEYKIIHELPQPLEIIDITDIANPKSENVKETVAAC